MKIIFQGKGSTQGTVASPAQTCLMVAWFPFRYQREICVVLLEGQDVNLAQVGAGLAWWYRQYAREQTAAQRHAYAEAEEAARDSRRGLWANDSPTPPWEWRHRGRPSSAKGW